jgi:hypothetical protein
VERIDDFRRRFQTHLGVILNGVFALSIVPGSKNYYEMILPHKHYHDTLNTLIKVLGPGTQVKPWHEKHVKEQPVHKFQIPVTIPNFGWTPGGHIFVAQIFGGMTGTLRYVLVSWHHP